METFQQNEVSRAVWRWQEGDSSPRRAGGMSPKKKVLITTPIALLIALGIYVWKGHLLMPAIVAAIALTICFCGLFVPPAFAAIERFFARFAVGVAVVLNWLLLVPVFYLIFTPARLLLLLRRKDPMFRTCPSDEKTYWAERPPITRSDYYETQH